LCCQLHAFLTSFFSAILVFMPPGSKFKIHSCPQSSHPCATRFIHSCHQPLNSQFHSSLLAVFAPLSICCCPSICAAIFDPFKTHFTFWFPCFLLVDALRIRTVNLSSLLPTVFCATSLNSLHCWLHSLLPSTYELNLYCTATFLSLPLGLLCGQFHMFLPFASILIHFCPWSFVLPVWLTANLAICTCFGLPIFMHQFLMLTFGCSPPFASGSRHIINFCLFACKHSCCAITIDSGWWWVLTFARVSIVSSIILNT